MAIIESAKSRKAENGRRKRTSRLQTVSSRLPGGRWQSWAITFLQWSIVAILVLLPFHALLSTWAGTSLGHYLWFKAWKEIWLCIMLVVAGVLIITDDRLKEAGKREPLHILIVAYTVLHLVVWALTRPPLEAAVLGFFINTRFLLFFGIVRIVGFYRPMWFNTRRLLQILLIPAGLVVLFGLLQVTVLPKDVLRHFGYSKQTIEPFLTIDEKPDLVRINSTLRGPNPLGAYLILPITAAVYMLLEKRRRKWYIGAGLAASLPVLYYSQSRSAWIGAVLAVGVLLVLSLPRWQMQRALRFGTPLLLGLAVILFLLRGTYLVQNVLFHTDEHSRSSISTNTAHGAAIEAAAKDIWHHPFGSGPGSAGPASFYSPEGTKLAENYYLQVGQEVGVLGMILFGLISLLVMYDLLQDRREPLALVLLSAFVGLCLVNLLLHGWADETVAMVWWGLAAAIKFSKTKEA